MVNKQLWSGILHYHRTNQMYHTQRFTSIIDTKVTIQHYSTKMPIGNRLETLLTTG